MLSFFLSYLLVYKYVVLFIVVALASFGIPLLPATALIMAAWAFAAQGYFDLYSIIIFTVLASVFGDMIGYGVSYRYGRGLFMKIGLKKLLLSSRFNTIEKLFSKHSNSSILLSRFLATSLGPVVNILAGLEKVSLKRFFFFDLIGEILYVIIFSGLGYIFGDQWEAISSISQDITTIVVLLIILIVLFILIWQVKNNRKQAYT